MMYPRPVLLATSIMGGIKILLAAAAVTDLVGAQVTGVIQAVILSAEFAVTKFYTEPRVVPLAQTIAYEDAQTMPRAGGAAGAPTNALVNPGASVAELLETHNSGTPGQ